MGLGAADDLGITRQFGDIMRQELRMRGRHATWGPMADLATEPRWDRVSSTIHAEGEVVASHIEIFVKSMQAANQDKNVIGLDGVVTFIKHFPGMGPNQDGMDSHSRYGGNNYYPGNNFQEHLLPWKAAFAAQAGGVMIGYSALLTEGFQGIAATYDPAVYKLLYELGFNGDIVTDNNPGAWNIPGLGDFEQTVDETRAERAAWALRNGANHYLGGDYIAYWHDADEKGWMEEADVNRAVTEALQLQFKLGLFENPYVNIKEAETFWDAKGSAMQNRVAAGKDAMAKSMVLVKNEKFQGIDVLPVVQRNTLVFDANRNGVIDVYFDSRGEGYDSGQPKTFALTSRYPERNFVSDVRAADVAIIRMVSRSGLREPGGTPLSYNGLTYVYDKEANVDTNIVVENDATLVAAQKEMARLQALFNAKAANPNLKIIVGITCGRPPIVEPWIARVDGMFIDYGVTDDVFLDMMFYHEGLEPVATLPIEIPSNDASVEAQFEDVPGDSANPTWPIGHGLEYVSTGYGK
jgi:beta-glucosidase